MLPSLYEGFGLQILEAMSTGIPVISSNVSSMPEIATKDGALFFHPTSIESIKNAMMEIDANQELREKLITTGFSRIRDFSWEKMGAETFALYKKFLSDQKK